jgi:lytic murein transglycosylase
MTLSLAAALAAFTLPLADTTAQFTRCLQSLEESKGGQRISAATWRHLEGVAPDPRILPSLDAQPEFRLHIWDYLAVMVDQERIDDAQYLLREHREVLERVRARYGVDPATVVAVWGVESNFGKGAGGFNVLRSLATLACEGRRQSYFRGELLAALRIVQGGHVEPDRFQGSWAGAFGHTQFMPSTFERLAVDFDGDGRRDLVGSVPDALASTANFLRNAGWRDGRPWGIEVRLPTMRGKPFSLAGEGRRTRRTLATWTARGLRRVDGSRLTREDLPGSTMAGLIAPAGADGPAFLVLRNFDAAYSYNAAVAYALAIVHLGDRVRGAPPFVTPWPTDDLGLSRVERRELQALLGSRGHDIGTPDGILGAKTRAAVREEQRRLGHPVTGRPGQKLLQALREM